MNRFIQKYRFIGAVIAVILITILLPLLVMQQPTRSVVHDRVSPREALPSREPIMASVTASMPSDRSLSRGQESHATQVMSVPMHSVSAPLQTEGSQAIGTCSIDSRMICSDVANHTGDQEHAVLLRTSAPWQAGVAFEKQQAVSVLPQGVSQRSSTVMPIVGTDAAWERPRYSLDASPVPVQSPLESVSLLHNSEQWVHWQLKIATFAHSRLAMAFVKRLQSQGFKTDTKDINQRGRHMTQVFVLGVAGDLRSMKQLQQRVRQATHLNGLLVKMTGAA